MSDHLNDCACVECEDLRPAAVAVQGAFATDLFPGEHLSECEARILARAAKAAHVFGERFCERCGYAKDSATAKEPCAGKNVNLCSAQEGAKPSDNHGVRGPLLGSINSVCGSQPSIEGFLPPIGYLPLTHNDCVCFHVGVLGFRGGGARRIHDIQLSGIGKPTLKATPYRRQDFILTTSQRKITSLKY